MKENLVFQKYERSKNIRSNGPVVRVNKGYFFLNRVLVSELSCERVDLFMDHAEKTVLIRPGNDFKLTLTSYGRATFSAAPFIHDMHIPDGFYPVETHQEGLIFSYDEDNGDSLAR